MAAFKAYTLWFPKERWPFINGLQMAAGGLGALAATKPVELALTWTDWRGVFIILSIATIICSFVVFFAVPEKKASKKKDSLQEQLRGLRSIFSSRIFWALAPLTTASQAAFLSIQGLWAGPWLMNVAQLNRDQTANTLFLIALAMIFGFVSIGWFTGWLSRKNISSITTAVTGMSIFMFAQLLLIVQPEGNTTLYWIFFGYTGTSGIIAYAALSQCFPATLSGRVTTAINLLVFVSAFCTQWLIGSIIDVFTPASASQLPARGFIWSFSTLLLLQLFGIICFFVLRTKPIDLD